MVIETVAFGILVTTSLSISIFVLVAHCLVPKMIRPPGDFIFLQAIAQVFIDLHWYSVFYSKELPSNSPQCMLIGVLTVFFTSFSMNCIFALCIDITIKLRNRATTTSKNKRLAYYLGIVGFPIFLIILSICNDDFGYSPSGTCSLKPLSLTSNIRLGSFIAEILIQICLICYIYVKIGSIYSKVTFNYFLVVVAESFFVLFSNLLKFVSLLINDPETQIILILFYEILSSSTGIAIGISRLYNKRLIKHLLWKLKLRKNKRFSNLMSSEYSSSSLINENVYNLGDLYDRITDISLLQMIVLISLKLRQAPKSLIDLEKEKDFDEYMFDQKLFENLVEDYENPKIRELYTPDLHLKEYYPREFAKIRDILGISDMNLFESFSITKNFIKLSSIQKAEGGRSSATLFFTCDNKFVLKTITNDEKRFFLKKMLNKYVQHIKSGSFLVRIIAIFRIEPAQVNFMVMENTIFDKQKAVVFDLKGSFVNRIVEGKYDYTNPPYGAILKDLNLMESLYKIEVSETVKENIQITLQKDINFLNEVMATDYSILLAFYQPHYKGESRYILGDQDHIYSISIIDYLQRYNIAKYSERFLKKLVYHNKEISVEAPQIYSSRLFSFIKSLFT